MVSAQAYNEKREKHQYVFFRTQNVIEIIHVVVSLFEIMCIAYVSYVHTY